MSLGAIAAAAGGALAGGLFNQAGSAANSALGWYFSKKAAKLNYKYQQKLAENRPTWNRVGLEKAGLNPILAANGGAGLGGAGLNVTTPIVGDSKLGSSMVEGAGAMAGIASAFAQKDKLKAETKLTKETTKGQQLENQNKIKTGKILDVQAEKELNQSDYYRNLSQKTFSEDMNLQYENMINSAKSHSFQQFVKENPTALQDALEGEYGAKAQAVAERISAIAKNWSSVASNATDLIPVKKLLSALIKAMGKSKKKP